jgi:hypothetical protein
MLTSFAVLSPKSVPFWDGNEILYMYSHLPQLRQFFFLLGFCHFLYSSGIRTGVGYLFMIPMEWQMACPVNSGANVDEFIRDCSVEFDNFHPFLLHRAQGGCQMCWQLRWGCLARGCYIGWGHIWANLPYLHICLNVYSLKKWKCNFIILQWNQGGTNMKFFKQKVTVNYDVLNFTIHNNRLFHYALFLICDCWSWARCLWYNK